MKWWRIWKGKGKSKDLTDKTQKKPAILLSYHNYHHHKPSKQQIKLVEVQQSNDDKTFEFISAGQNLSSLHQSV